MKKIIALSLVAALFAAAPAVKAQEAGGLGGACVGCCFGFRTAIDYNDGQKLNVHDILDILSIGRIWSAIEGYNGTTRSEMHKSEPAYF